MIRIIYVLSAVCLVTAILLPVQIFVYTLGMPWRQKIPIIWHKSICFILGFRIKVQGKPSVERPLLMVSNHISWSDILILGACAPLSFVAKQEVGRWPIIGFLARLNGAIFIDRTQRHKTQLQTSLIEQRLNAGDAVVLFAEGTTSNGTSILPFKSSLFAVAQNIAIQPVTLSYTSHYGINLSRAQRTHIAWSGTIGLISHILRVIKMPYIGVVVTFGEPVDYTHEENRKDRTKKIEYLVKKAHENALYGNSNRVISRELIKV